MGIFKLILAIRNFKPDVIHFVSAKGLLIGILVHIFSKVRKRVVSISGVGNFLLKKKSCQKLSNIFI